MSVDLRQMIWDFVLFLIQSLQLFFRDLALSHLGREREGYWTTGLVKFLGRLNQKNREPREKSISSGKSE